jgi:tRNA(Phe) wybutosine-synthesizing methylase Tyw3
MSALQIIIVMFSSNFITSVLSIVGFKQYLLKNKAITSQEIEKSEQQKISTADQALDLANKLLETTNKRFDEQDKEMEKLRAKLNQYVDQCSVCPNNKITKKKNS